jgi:hypothetical protein
MQQAIIGLEQVVAAALAKPGTESPEPSRPDAGDGSSEQPGGLEPDAEAIKPGSESEPEPEPKPEPAAVTESERAAARWAAFGSGADMFAARLRGEPVPASRTQNPMLWAQKAAPAMYTPRQLSWVSRRQRATYLREPFDEPPPDDMPRELY